MILFRKVYKNQNGFSLAETLVALIIILLVSTVVAAGMPAAQKAYVNVLESANAQMFLSTTLIELRDELAAATEITVSGDKKTVTYDNPKTGSSTIFLDNGRYKIRTYLDLDTSDQNPARPLVSDAAKTASLKLNPEPAITYDPVKGLITISAFGIESSKTNSKVAELRQPYKIKVLVPKDS